MVLEQPTEEAVDRADKMYVTDQVTGYVQKLSPSGEVLTSQGGWGTGRGRFHRPEQVAVDARDNVDVGDTDNNRIERFTSSGDFRDTFGGRGTLSQPSGVAVDPQGHVYVTDWGNHRAVELLPWFSIC